MKNNMVVGVGLVVIICIVVLVTWGCAEFTNLSANTANVTNSLLIQQKDMEIKKLAKQLKAKQAEIDGLKAKIAGVNAKIENIKADLTGTKSAAAR